MSLDDMKIEKADIDPGYQAAFSEGYNSREGEVQELQAKVGELEQENERLTQDIKQLIAPHEVGGGPVPVLQARVRELEERLIILKKQRVKYGPICLVCGAAEPCYLKDDPHSPCTFDPAPRELWDRCQEQKKQIVDLEAKLRQVEEDLDRALKARVNFEEGIESMRCERTALQRRYSQVCKERDQLRARMGELEEALAFIRDYLDTCAEPPDERLAQGRMILGVDR